MTPSWYQGDTPSKFFTVKLLPKIFCSIVKYTIIITTGVEKAWQSFRDTTKDVAEKVVGNSRKRGQRKATSLSWWNEEVKTAVRRKKKCTIGHWVKRVKEHGKTTRGQARK